MIKRLVDHLLAAVLTTLCGVLAAETNAYQIEIIVFSQNLPTTETFDQTSSRIDWPDNLTELSSYPQTNQMMLDESYVALSKDPAYQPLVHIAWIQSIEANSPGDPVHVQSPDGKVNGFVQMQRGQTLHLLADLEYTASQSDENGEPLVYRLNEKRQFQLNDLQYLDHPTFGVIVQISPYKSYVVAN